MTMPYDDAGTSRVTRFEVFTGAGRRRDWPPEVKASILAESFSGQETVCSVARRHGMSPSQLFTWRRQLRKQMESQGAGVPAFVPAVVDVGSAEELAPVAHRPKQRRRSKASAVELEIDGVAVKISRGADAGVIAAVIEALRAKAWLRYYDVEPDQFDFILASWDTASTLSEEADWSVGTIWGVADGSIYLLHVERERLESPELRHRIEAIHSQFHVDVTIIEDAALGRGIVQDLRRTSPTCQPIAIPVRIEKIARMQARAVMFETGKVSRNFREAGTAA